jgi:hypothetical protein
VTTNHTLVDDSQEVSEIVSVSFKPEALTAIEEWRWIFTRYAPGRRRPIVRAMVAVVYILLALPFLGFLIGNAGRPNLQPETMSLAFFAVGLLYPYRLWRVKRAATQALRGLGPFTVDLDGESVTIRVRNRLSRIDWAGVVEIRRNAREIVLRYQAGDASWVPTRFFADPEHEARFLQLAESGLAHSRSGPHSPPDHVPR